MPYLLLYEKTNKQTENWKPVFLIISAYTYIPFYELFYMLLSQENLLPTLSMNHLLLNSQAHYPSLTSLFLSLIHSISPSCCPRDLNHSQLKNNLKKPHKHKLYSPLCLSPVTGSSLFSALWLDSEIMAFT